MKAICMTITMILLLVPCTAIATSLSLQEKIRNSQSQGHEIGRFASLSNSALARRAVQGRLQSLGNDDVIGMQRIFVSDLFSLNIGNKSYITNSTADYLLGSDLSEIFLTEPGLKKVSTSNDTISDLMKLSVFIESSKEILPSYNGYSSKPPIKVYAFIDVTCPHCKSFHLTHRAKLQQKGVSFVYVPFLRDVSNKKSRKANIDVFCSSTPEDALDEYFLSGSIVGDGSDSVCSQLQLTVLNFLFQNGERYGLAGSPMFLMEYGSVIYGGDALLSEILSK
jgi:protein-disulfide isomerase